jgi:transcriptional regulator
MYIPETFREPDAALAFDLIEAHGFAALLSGPAGALSVSHVPLLLERAGPGGARLLGHLARANRHWTEFDGARPALAIFEGPHAYVSPSWYAEQPAVPTWNYAVVHVHGAPRVLDPQDTREVIRRLVSQYEEARPRPWTRDVAPDWVDNLLGAVVGFELPISRVESKFKLGQNRSAADREGMLAGLAAEGDAGAHALAVFTRRHFARKKVEP